MAALPAFATSSSYSHGIPTTMHKRLLPVSIVAAVFSLLSACGGNNDTVTTAPTPVAPAPAAAPISTAALVEIDNFVQAQMQRQHIPGLSLVVTMDGKPVLEKGYGMANLETRAATTASTVYQIGSVSKQFAASAIMLLVQDGRLNLDDPMAKYLSTAPAAWSGITIRQLMQHTSGLPRDFAVELLEQVDPAKLPPIDTLVALAGQMPLEARPGAQHSYSNVGYHLLGFVIEKISGKYYGDFLQERLFGPIGMSSADVILTRKPVPTMAKGYAWNNGALVPASGFTMTPGLIEAEGGLQMSASDLAKWDAALGTDKYLSRASLTQMWAPARLNDGSTVPYGLGWVLDEINHLPYTWHNGSVDGFSSQFDRHTGQGMSVIVLANMDLAGVHPIAERISAIIKPELEWVLGTDPQPRNSALLRVLLDEAARGAVVVDDRFTAQARAAFTPAVIAAYSNYFKQFVNVERFGYIDQTIIDGKSVSRYLLRSKLDRAVVHVAFDADGKVALLTVR